MRVPPADNTIYVLEPEPMFGHGSALSVDGVVVVVDGVVVDGVVVVPVAACVMAAPPPARAPTTTSVAMIFPGECICR